MKIQETPGKADFVVKGDVRKNIQDTLPTMSDELKPDPETDSTTAEELARVADAKALAKQGFIRWFLVRFSTRAHFMRFIATIILLFTVITMVRGASLPEAWWSILGMTLGYYFRGASAGDSGKGHD